MKKLFTIVSLSALALQVQAEGSKDLFKQGQAGYRTHLMARGNSESAANFDPFPTSGVHKVYAKSGERIYAGSSVGSSSNIKLFSPTGTSLTWASSSGTSAGKISNRAQELAGPYTSSNTSGYVALYYDVTAEGIYEVQIMNSGTGTTLDGTIVDYQISNSTFLQTSTPGTALVAAWDVTVGTGVNKSTFLTGRVYTNTLNLTGSNGVFNQAYLYSKVYVLTPQGYVFEVDNNGNNGASFNFFSNNKGIIDNYGKPTYKSLDAAAVSGKTIDPRIPETAGNITNKIFYNQPDLDNFPATANIHYSATSTSSASATTTWLKGTVVPPELSDVYVTCDGKVIFKSNIVGRYQILIDGNDNGSYNDNVDFILTGDAILGVNTVVLTSSQMTAINSLTSLPSKLSVKLTTAEVHFPFADMESNLNGIKIKRIGASSNADIIFWNHSNISLSATPPSVLRQLSGISSANGANNWGSNASGSSGEGSQFGNNKVLDTWTFVYEETEVSINKFMCVTVSGSVWNDLDISHTKNGSEAFVNGTSTNATVGAPLYVYAVNADDIIISKSPVSNTGTYSLSNVPANSNVKLYLGTEDLTVGTTLEANISLPVDWKYVSQNQNGNGAANTNSYQSITTTATSNIVNINFGIYKTPKPGSGVEKLEDEGGTYQVTVPTTSFSNIMPSQAGNQNVKALLITTMPVGATSITVNGVTYTSIPQGGIPVPANTSGEPTVPVTVDPAFEGRGDVVISFFAVDVNDQVSNTSGAATLKFGATIEGSVWNDGDGDLTKDSNEDRLTGSTTSNPATNVEALSTPLYAYLVDAATNKILQAVPVDENGQYKFDNIYEDVALKVVISTTVQVKDATLAAPTLPNDWVAIGVNDNGSKTNNGSTSYNVGIITDNKNNVDFGIESKPTTTGNDQQLAKDPKENQMLPLNNTVATTDGTLNSLAGSDKETPAANLTLKINELPYTDVGGFNQPVDAKMYYDGVEINATNFPKLEIANFDPALLSIQLIGAGYTNVGFDFSFIDVAGIASEVASYMINWTNPLPLTLVAFDVKLNGDKVSLDWTTNHETDMAHFEVEHSSNGTQWSQVGQVMANNAEGINNYNFIHALPTATVNMYRLKMVNTDLSYAYSTTKKIAVNGINKTITVYPNPAVDMLTVKGVANYTTLKIANMLGQVVVEQNVTEAQVVIDVTNLSEGQYIILLSNVNAVESVKFLKK